MFPTRYALELEALKGSVTSESFKEPSQRKDTKKAVKKLFEDRYTSGKNKWFFQPLRVRYNTLPSMPLLTSKPLVLNALFVSLCPQNLLYADDHAPYRIYIS